MESFDPHAYGPVFAEILQVERLRELDEGSPETELRSHLEGMTIEKAFSQDSVSDEEMARCCLAGAWLLCDFLDESHTISQAIGSPSGSFWHGIMHRREGDFSNAKYWFNRVGEHPVYEEIAAAVGQSRWDPFAFVDECRTAVRSSGAEAEHCRQLQQSEWEVLFDYCYRAALQEC